MLTEAERRAIDSGAATPARQRRSLWERLTPRKRDLLAFAVIVAALLLPLRGMLRSPGPPMEEGFMLAFPERVLAGDIANLDFLHLYGPGSLWVLAAVYKVFGTTLEIERLFGLFQQAGMAFGAYFVARWWGRRVALMCALLTIAIMLPPAGLIPFAWIGGIALGLLGLGFGLHARAATDERRARWLAIASGVLFGVAFLYRLDLVISITLAIAVLMWRAPRARIIALVGSAVATSSLLLVHVAMAGLGNSFRGMVIEPVFKLRPGRRLPLPSWDTFFGFPQIQGFKGVPLRWPLPTLTQPAQLFVWFYVNLIAIALLVAIGVWALGRDRTSIRARGVLAVGLFSLGMVSQSLQRPDSTHVSWVACVSVGLLPIAFMEVLNAWRARAGPSPRRLRAGRHAWVVACGIPLAVTFLGAPNYTIRNYADLSAQTFDRHRGSFLIERGERRFYYGDPTIADAANEMIPELDRLVRPGDRLFVGPTDMRRTITSEAWLYYLYPEATPATRYIEMDPGIADAEGSGLASDLRSADVVVLSKIYFDWVEPNDSMKFGSNRPNRVLRKQFCSEGKFGFWFEVFRRCDR